MDSELFKQAVVRAGRTLVAGLIASAITLLPQTLDVFHLDPTYSGAIILGLTTLLNGLGKALREPTIEVSGDVDVAREVLANAPEAVEPAHSAPIPF